jgi:hypothetical protein
MTTLPTAPHEDVLRLVVEFLTRSMHVMRLDSEMYAVPRPSSELHDDEAAGRVSDQVMRCMIRILQSDTKERMRVAIESDMYDSYGKYGEDVHYGIRIARMRIQRAMDHGGLWIHFNKMFHDTYDRPSTIDCARGIIRSSLLNYGLDD